ncbi:MAG: ADP-ribosylglycohydrolase family protein [Victivallales bacterium]|nr:ADP-ribosylglycohydrolase family protein [Victivallales bacterium]
MAVKDYEEQVFAGVLGKVIGVYAGRPFEGWWKDALEKRWGFIDRYVHKDQNVPLVVSDDDISGTLTFVRALEDSGLYEKTPDEFFGETWLNYLLEGKTILWWGGMGHSTEHTAYLRLKAGMKSPQSGSIETNGKTVAEQIGAQIFIDGFGLVCPGDPQLAAKLARKAASVSHDGEAVNAAVVVAGMEAAAFVEKDMEKLLDIGVSLIPKNSLIAKLHRDVRAWCKKDGDWRKTYDRINEKYGYHIYGGNCHVIPNHALMVMAWSYAPNDFRKALAIVNTAGWDTDCNSANVGCLMALIVGLDKICESYDYRSEMADRIILPTADGTRSVTDCLTEALQIAAIGRKVMGWKPLKDASHWLDFTKFASPRGFMLEPSERGIDAENNTLHWLGEEKHKCLQFSFWPYIGGTARISKPMMPGSVTGGYSVVGTSKLYSSMTVKAKLLDGTSDGVRMFVRYMGADGKPMMAYSESNDGVRAVGEDKILSLTVPETNGQPVTDLGFEINLPEKCSEGKIRLAFIDLEGGFHYQTDRLPAVRNGIPGWIVDCDMSRGRFSEDKEELVYFGKNSTTGYAYTGNRYWKDQSIEARLAVHLADAAGLMCRWQGTQRYISLTRRGNKLVLARQFYGETILAECVVDWKLGDVHDVKLECRGNDIIASFDGKKVLIAKDDKLSDGAAGFIYSVGMLGIGRVEIKGKI